MKYIFIIIVLTAAIFWLISGYMDFSKPGKRFTYTDGQLLYEMCEKRKKYTKEEIEIFYKDKSTDFKKFLLSK